MTVVTVTFLGGLQPAQGKGSLEIEMSEGSTVGDLGERLRALGFGPGSTAILVTLNGRGLHQWPPDWPVAAADEVAVFPRITGGRA